MCTANNGIGVGLKKIIHINVNGKFEKFAQSEMVVYIAFFLLQYEIIQIWIQINETSILWTANLIWKIHFSMHEK